MPAEAGARRANNFDALRLLAAISVVFSHSFLIAEGSEASEPFAWLTGNQCILGLVGVFVFFVISGYLVTESWCRSPNPRRFVSRRLLRIYPGLLVNGLVCALLLGPLVTSLPLRAYFADPALRGFLGSVATLDPGPLHLPGVLFADNSVGLLVNGSLWTLRYEVMMYALVLVLGALNLLRLSVSIALVGIGIAAVYFEKALTPFGDFGGGCLVPRFLRLRDGALLPARADRLRLALCAARARRAGAVRRARPFHHAVPARRRLSRDLVRPAAMTRCSIIARYAGDLSYGVYIYGWPSEQLVMWLSGGRAVVAGIRRIARHRLAGGVAVLARRREMGAALGSPGARVGAGACPQAGQA